MDQTYPGIPDHEGRGCALANASDGHTCTVIAITGGQAMRRRLMDLNVIPGQDISVIQNDGWGPVLAGVDGARIVLGRGMAEHVSVRCSGVCAGRVRGRRGHRRSRRRYHGDNERCTR